MGPERVPRTGRGSEMGANSHDISEAMQNSVSG